MTFAELAAVIGERATRVVQGLGFFPDAANPRARQEQKVAHLAMMALRSLEAVAIKGCNRYCNVVDVRFGKLDYAAEYLAKGEAFFTAIESLRCEINYRWGNGATNRLLGLRDELQQ